MGPERPGRNVTTAEPNAGPGGTPGVSGQLIDDDADVTKLAPMPPAETAPAETPAADVPVVEVPVVEVPGTQESPRRIRGLGFWALVRRHRTFSELPTTALG